MLEMYINNLLIDRAETDFRFASTVRERDENVKDLCNHLYKENMDKAFISHQKPAFFLVAESKANMIIQQDNDEALEYELSHELDSHLKIKQAMYRLCKL